MQVRTSLGAQNHEKKSGHTKDQGPRKIKIISKNQRCWRKTLGLILLLQAGRMSDFQVGGVHPQSFLFLLSGHIMKLLQTC